MENRYYGLKALLMGAAFAAVIAGGGLECSKLALPHDSHYQAAYVAQSAIRTTSVELSHAVRQLFSRAFADL